MYPYNIQLLIDRGWSDHVNNIKDKQKFRIWFLQVMWPCWLGDTKDIKPLNICCTTSPKGSLEDLWGTRTNLESALENLEKIDRK